MNNVDTPLDRFLPVEVGEGVEVELPFDPEDMEIEEPEPSFNPETDNLADLMDENDLTTLASQVVQDYTDDRQTRSDWERLYIEGLNFLGLKNKKRSEPWDGACSVYHPVMMEAAVRFQSGSILEIFPAKGPAKAKIIPTANEELLDQGLRVEREMNYQMTENMTEFRSETEQMLFHVAVAGSGFKKTWYCSEDQRPKSIFVPSEQFIVPYGCSDLDAAERFTHVIPMSEFEMEQNMASGFYRRLDISASRGQYSEIEDKVNELEGLSLHREDRYTVIEQHLMADLEDDYGVKQYIVTVDLSSHKILGVRRNWNEKRKRTAFFTHYPFIPGMGFYGLGLIHLIGGLTKGATSVLRQLVDAGTLSNLPPGLKARGLRIKSDGESISPGKFRDVDTGGSSIRDSIYFIPYKEPSAVLHTLMREMVEEARKLGSVGEMKIGQIDQNAPVGTMLAIMEQAMKVPSAIHSRLHHSLAREMKIIQRIEHENMGPRYDWDLKGEFNRIADFDTGIVSVIPVSDPNASTMAQKVAQHQVVIQMAAQNPEIYNVPEVHRQLLIAIGLPEASGVIKGLDAPPMLDPVSENMRVMQGEAIKAYPEQDHGSHLTAHMNAINNPYAKQMLSQSSQGAAISAAMEAHIAEHLAFEYRNEIEKQIGAPLPLPGETLPQNVEYELSGLIAKASSQMLSEQEREAQIQKNAEIAEDPMIQLRNKEVALKDAMRQDKQEIEIARLRQRQKELTVKDRNQDLDRQLEAAKIGLDALMKKATSDDDRKSKEELAALDDILRMFEMAMRAESKSE